MRHSNWKKICPIKKYKHTWKGRCVYTQKKNGQWKNCVCAVVVSRKILPKHIPIYNAPLEIKSSVLPGVQCFLLRFYWSWNQDHIFIGKALKSATPFRNPNRTDSFGFLSTESLLVYEEGGCGESSIQVMLGALLLLFPNQFFGQSQLSAPQLIMLTICFSKMWSIVLLPGLEMTPR